MKSLEYLPAEKQQGREEQKKKRESERESPERALSERERAKPKCAARDEDPDPRARKIQNNRCHDQDQRENPDDPPFSSLAKIVLTAAKKHDRGEPEKISGLIPIWKWTEIVLVVPGWECGVCQVKRDPGCVWEGESGGE